VFGRLIDRLLLANGPNPLVLILDEVDLLTRLPYGASMLNAIRQLHEARAREFVRYQRLVLVLVGLRPLADFVKPDRGVAAQFCAGLRLQDFDASTDAVEAIGTALPELENREALARRILWHTGGQPLLTMLMLDNVRRRGMASVAEVDAVASEFALRKSADPEVLFATARRLILDDRHGALAALSTYMGLLNSSPECQKPVAPGAELLQASGIVRLKDGKLEVKCPIFERAFDRSWAEGTFSQAGTERQRLTISTGRAGRKKVCIINTGGTIGMVQRRDTVVAPESAEEFLSYHPELQELADVDFIQMFVHDSINIYPNEWKSLARYIYDQRRKGYAGFVVAHGTDTMTFTASAVAFALGPNLSFPVVFTGAQTTPDKYHGDARTNLYRAVLTAQQQLHETVICFGDRVFRACRAQKRDDQRFEGFESPTYPELAIVTEEVNVRRELLRPAPHPGVDIQLQNEFQTGVLEIAQYPGLEPEFFTSLLRPLNQGDGPRCNGVIIQTLGAGNIATRDPYSFLPFVRHAVKELKIPVLVTSQYPPDPESYKKYSPAQAPVEAGAIHAGNMTSAAAVSKFRWVLAQVKNVDDHEERIEQIRHMMVEIDYVGELAKPTKK